MNGIFPRGVWNVSVIALNKYSGLGLGYLALKHLGGFSNSGGSFNTSFPELYIEVLGLCVLVVIECLNYR